MIKDQSQLPKNSKQLELIIRRLESENEILREKLRLANMAKYAPSSEKSKDGPQCDFFNEAELEDEISDKDEELKRIHVKGYTKKAPKRKPLPKDLPRETVMIELEGEDRKCGCGEEMKEIGSDKSEKLDVIPMQMKVIETHRKKYACQNCEGSLKRAALPLQAIPKSMASPGLLAFTAVSKYADSLPLYRQEGIYKRYGIEISRSTLANWMVKCGDLVIPLINLMWDELLSENYLQMDETHVLVLKEPGKKPTTKSYMWTTARMGENAVVLFEYDPTRSGSVATRLLEGFQGYLQVDGYAGYNGLCKNPKIMRVGCGYHIRRKFDQARRASKKSKQKGAAHRALGYFKAIFKVDEIARENNYTHEERYELRQEKAKPILAELKQWLDDQNGKYPPKSKIGNAIQYAINEWGNFIRYLDDGRLEIGTIFIENKIRPFAVGRRNWLFCDTVRGARSSAALYSLIETAKSNGLNPYDYLKRVFEEIPKAETLQDYERLLPFKKIDEEESQKRSFLRHPNRPSESGRNNDLPLFQNPS